ncbi:hypothetical protein [Spirosoma spitsbergense]|uniref:hypothetical protein n=1 Tax=Spirosoma spitsbergense TaxID=431554 RepID=UPI00037332A1|nr:hypothetical protein [Spirosoma spitsbergense]
MKYGTHRDWQPENPSRRGRSNFDYTTALGSLAAALLVYIIYHIYPLVSQGLLW